MQIETREMMVQMRITFMLMAWQGSQSAVGTIVDRWGEVAHGPLCEEGARQVAAFSAGGFGEASAPGS